MADFVSGGADAVMELSPKVTTAIDKFFPEGDRPVVAELLSTYGERPHEREAERLHLLILKMSRRKVGRVRSLVEAAKRDYRDVIMWASQPTRTYIVGLLRKGPKFSHGDTLKLASLESWKKAGAIVIGGLCVDESELHGLYLFTVDSIGAAENLVRSDPAIEAGRLRFEFHPWHTADGLQVGVPKDFLEVES